MLDRTLMPAELDNALLCDTLDLALRLPRLAAWHGLDEEAACALERDSARLARALAADVEAFLARGGRVEHIEPGATAWPDGAPAEDWRATWKREP